MQARARAPDANARHSSVFARIVEYDLKADGRTLEQRPTMCQRVGKTAVQLVQGGPILSRYWTVLTTFVAVSLHPSPSIANRRHLSSSPLFTTILTTPNHILREHVQGTMPWRHVSVWVCNQLANCY